MPGLLAGMGSSVGKKVLMALTGLAMAFFAISHLIGNLLLLSSNPDPYNAYSHALLSMGVLLYIAEFGLLAFFLMHIFSGISVTLGKRRARPDRYAKSGNAGGPSQKTVASTTMIYTGLVLLVFIVLHIKTFKYGPYYSTVVDNVEMRDLYRLVIETFQNPIYVVWYVGSMALLGFHLRHGFWSAFQSLGMNYPHFIKQIQTAGIAIAALLAIGFMGIPVWIFLNS